MERYSRTPVAGIVVLGSTGEAILLSDQERRDVLKSAREAAAPNKSLIAGTGIESAIETLRLTEYAEIGEAILLSDQERRDVLKSAREAAAPNKSLIAGTGIESAIETLRLTEYA